MCKLILKVRLSVKRLYTKLYFVETLLEKIYIYDVLFIRRVVRVCTWFVRLVCVCLCV